MEKILNSMMIISPHIFIITNFVISTIDILKADVPHMSIVVFNELLGGVHGVDVVRGKAGTRPSVAALAQE